MLRWHKSLVFLVAAVSVGCTDIFSPACTLELGIRISPLEPIIQVGETVKPELELSSCDGREVLISSWRLASESGTAVEILSDLKSFKAVHTGHALLSVRDDRYGVVGEIRVQVVEK